MINNNGKYLKNNSSLFKDNPKEVFLIELKNQITSFHKNEYLGYSITDADISSLAYLIWDYFSYYYYNLLWNLNANQAVKITSYSEYDHGYWDPADPSKYNKIIDK
ncbi:hypothetical protein ACMBCM_00900 [Spiroplasma sp. K1]